MDGTTITLLAGAGALGGGAAIGGFAAWCWLSSKSDRLVTDAIEMTREEIKSQSDSHITKIYDAIERLAVDANSAASATTQGRDVSEEYGALTSEIRTKLAGMYNLNKGIFEMVLSVIQRNIEELRIITPNNPVFVDGETITTFPNSSSGLPVERAHPSVNDAMKERIKIFYFHSGVSGMQELLR